MHKFFQILFLFLVISSVSAEESPLCSPGCSVVIDFPEGGSIQAPEGASFIFDVNGVLDLGATGTVNTSVQPESIDFSAGGTLTLAAGESITFDAGGLLDLGQAGNINTISVIVETSGSVTVRAQEGVGTTFRIGRIRAKNQNYIGSTGADVYVVESVSTDSLLAGTLDTCASNAVPADGVTLSSSDFSVSSQTTTCAVSNAVFTDSILSAENNIVWSLQEELPPGDLSNAEIRIALPDGSSCVVTEDQCVSEDGTVYQQVDGEWVEVGNGGSFSALMLLAFSLSIGILRRRSAGLLAQKV